MKRPQFPLTLLFHSSCWKIPPLVLTQAIDTVHVTCACVTSHLSFLTGQLVRMAAVKPTQQLTNVLGTTSVLEASTHALKNKWSCMFSSPWPSMHWLTDVRQLSRDPRWPLHFPGFLLSPANGQQFNLRTRGTCFDYREIMLNLLALKTWLKKVLKCHAIYIRALNGWKYRIRFGGKWKVWSNKSRSAFPYCHFSLFVTSELILKTHKPNIHCRRQILIILTSTWISKYKASSLASFDNVGKGKICVDTRLAGDVTNLLSLHPIRSSQWSQQWSQSSPGWGFLLVPHVSFHLWGAMLKISICIGTKCEYSAPTRRIHGQLYIFICVDCVCNTVIVVTVAHV